VVANKWLQISSEGKNAKTKIAIIGNKTPDAISRAASDHILMAWGNAVPNVLLKARLVTWWSFAGFSA
jgi:hypothetical protein